MWDNDLVATSASNTSDGETNKADGASGDLGSFDDGTSGMDSMKVYLTAIAADADNTVQVNFDTVSTETDTETTGTTTTTLNVVGATSSTSTTNEATVLKMIPAVANTADAAKSAIGQKNAYIITPVAVNAGNDAGTALGTVQFTVSNVALFDTSLTGQGTALSLSGNPITDIDAVKSTINVSRANSVGLTLDAKRGANSTASITLRDVVEVTGTSVIGERYTTTAAVTAAATSTNYGVGSDDYVTVTIGSNSVTATGASATAIAGAVYTAWAAKYHSSGTASATAIATMTSPTIGDADSSAMAWTMNQEDSGGYGVAISVSATAGATTATSAANIDWTIGASNLTTNNTTPDDGVSTIMTLESQDILTAIPAVTTAVSAAASMAAILLATTKTTNTTWSNGDFHTGALEPVTDLRDMEAAVAAATSNAVAATNFSRVTWLG